MGDREIVRARRALFMAAALSTLATSARAAPPSRPNCKWDTEPSAEDKELAKQLFKEASARAQAGDYEAALDHSLRAFQSFPNPVLAMFIGTAYRAFGQPNDAVIWYQAALDCGLSPELETKTEADMEAVKAGAGQIQIRFEPSDTGGQAQYDKQEILLDDKAIDPSGTIYVTPGEHRLTAVNPDGLRTTLTFVIRVGESQTLELELPPPIVPHVCLSPLPCLQPPPPDEEVVNRHRLSLDLAPVALVDMDRDGYRNNGFGASLALAHSFPLGASGLRAAIGIEATPVALRSGFFMPAGMRLEGLVPFARRLTVGIGVSAGYAFTGGDAASDDTLRPADAPYLEPYVPFDIRLGSRVNVGIRPGILFTKQESVSDERFGLGFFRMGVFLRYSFSAACDEERDSDCRPPVMSALR